VVIDTSAIIAILLRETLEGRLVTAMAGVGVRRMSAVGLVEAGIVVQRRLGDVGERELDVLLHRAGIEIVPVLESHAQLARSAYRQFGKGRHAAQLNLGDCFSYALAKALDEPLLFVGNDFGHTDISTASY